MTSPPERTRALRLAAEFLAQCSARRDELPSDLACQLDEILMHYPTADDVTYAAANFIERDFSAEQWVMPELGRPYKDKDED